MPRRSRSMPAAPSGASPKAGTSRTRTSSTASAPSGPTNPDQMSRQQKKNAVRNKSMESVKRKGRRSRASEASSTSGSRHESEQALRDTLTVSDPAASVLIVWVDGAYSTFGVTALTEAVRVVRVRASPCQATPDSSSYHPPCQFELGALVPDRLHFQTPITFEGGDPEDVAGVYFKHKDWKPTVDKNASRL